MRFPPRLILSLIAGFLIAACVEEPETITSNGDNITGGWAAGCYADGNNGATESMTYSGGGLTFFMDGWLSDTACSGSSDFTFTGSTSITFVTTKVASGVTVSTYDWTDTAFNLIPNKGSTADQYTSAGNFGFSGWASGVPYSVLGIDTSGGTAAITGRGIIHVDRSVSPDTLQLGDESAATDTSGYPESLNSSVIFLKQ